jgi:hypothetical protein
VRLCNKFRSVMSRVSRLTDDDDGARTESADDERPSEARAASSLFSESDTPPPPFLAFVVVVVCFVTARPLETLVQPNLTRQGSELGASARTSVTLTQAHGNTHTCGIYYLWVEVH